MAKKLNQDVVKAAVEFEMHAQEWQDSTITDAEIADALGDDWGNTLKVWEARAAVSFARKYARYPNEMREAYRRVGNSIIEGAYYLWQEDISRFSGLDTVRIPGLMDEEAPPLEHYKQLKEKGADVVVVAPTTADGQKISDRIPHTLLDWVYMARFGRGALDAEIYISCIHIEAALKDSEWCKTKRQHLITRRWKVAETGHRRAASSVPKIHVPRGQVMDHTLAGNALLTVGERQDKLFKSGQLLYRATTPNGDSISSQKSVICLNVKEAEAAGLTPSEILAPFRLDGYDTAVYRTACTLIYPYITEERPVAEWGAIPLSRFALQIYKRSALTRVQSQDMLTSIQKMIGLTAWIACPLFDLKTGCVTDPQSPQFTSILPAKIIFETVDGRSNVPCLRFLDVPPLYVYSRGLDQHEELPEWWFELPDMNYTRNNIAVQQHLVDRAKRAAWLKDESVDVLYTDLYRAARLPDSKGMTAGQVNVLKGKRRAVISAASKILESWKQKNNILDYERKNKGPVRKFVIVP